MPLVTLRAGLLGPALLLDNELQTEGLNVRAEEHRLLLYDSLLRGVGIFKGPPEMSASQAFWILLPRRYHPQLHQPHNAKPKAGSVTEASAQRASSCKRNCGAPRQPNAQGFRRKAGIGLSLPESC